MNMADLQEGGYNMQDCATAANLSESKTPFPVCLFFLFSPEDSFFIAF